MTVQSQTVMTVSEAVEVALSNNLGIAIAKNERSMAQNNVSKANAGQVPSLNLVAGVGGSNVNTRQVFANGQEQNRNFANAINGNVGVQLNWTLYDGKRMYRTFDRLTAQAQLSDFQLQLAAENLTSAVLQTYSEAVRIQQIIAATQKNLTFYDERIRLAEARVAAGTAGKPNLLQTQIDKNVQQAQLLQAENALNLLKIQLNQLMLRDASTPIVLQDSLPMNENLALENLTAMARSGNRQMILAQQTTQIAVFSLGEAEAARRPQVNLNATYNFARAENQAGFLLSNQNYGLTAAVTATYNLYDGKLRQRIIENAKLAVQNAQLREQDSWQQINAAIAMAFAQWQTARQTIDLEKNSLLLAQENLKIAEDRFRFGGSDILPLREAQKSFEDGQIRLINARHAAKLAEIRLFQLTGQL